jgi:hypothetical protein
VRPGRRTWASQVPARRQLGIRQRRHRCSGITNGVARVVAFVYMAGGERVMTSTGELLKGPSGAQDAPGNEHLLRLLGEFSGRVLGAVWHCI